MKYPALPMISWCCAAAVMAVLSLGGQPRAVAQEEGPALSKGENFSAKPAPALFQSDCTGAGCHKGPQGLAKGQTMSSLTGFLREHYTNSRESAASLAAYLSKVPSGPEPREPHEARKPKPSRGASNEPASASPGEGFFSGLKEQKPEPRPRREVRPEPEAKPSPNETRASHQRPGAKPSHAASRTDEETPAARSGPAEAKESETSPKAAARGQRGKPPVAAAAPPPAPEAPPPPPPKKQYDIFD